jgi:hypothetical protein
MPRHHASGKAFDLVAAERSQTMRVVTVPAYSPSRAGVEPQEVWRVYCLMQLNRRRRGKRRVATRHPSPLVAGEQVNASWSIDPQSGRKERSGLDRRSTPLHYAHH